MAAVVEQPVFFDCEGSRLLGILHTPVESTTDVGMVLVVGGPQYRVGSHRQFVLLARDVAASGVPVLRFDYRGMGDSDGQIRDFEVVAVDIRVAIDTLCTELPGVRRIVLWGLCDAASANAFYAQSDRRVVGQIGANPWVRTVEGEAQAFMRHYYLKRLASGEFWRKVIRFDFNLVDSLTDFVNKFRQTRRPQLGAVEKDTRPLPLRLRDAQRGYGGAMMLVLSGQDLTAREYLDRVDESPEWRAWLASDAVKLHRFDEADHTFSSAAWRDQVAAWTCDWIASLDSNDSDQDL